MYNARVWDISSVCLPFKLVAGGGRPPSIRSQDLRKSGNRSVAALSNAALGVCQAFCDIRFRVDLEIRSHRTERPGDCPESREHRVECSSPSPALAGRRPRPSSHFMVPQRLVRMLR